MVTEAAHWFGYAETRTAATASMACVLWHSCASVRRVIQMYAFNTGPSRLRAELSACKGTSKQRAMQSFEEPSLRSWSEASSGTKIGGQKSHFLRSRSLPRPALLSCPLVPFDAWLYPRRDARALVRATRHRRDVRGHGSGHRGGTPRCRRRHHGRARHDAFALGRRRRGSSRRLDLKEPN